MKKCHFCDKEGIRHLSAVDIYDAKKILLPSSEDEVRLCEEHNSECWDIINRERGALSILTVVVGLVVCVIGVFITYLILNGIILKLSAY